jgi:hypothetical protein
LPAAADRQQRALLPLLDLRVPAIPAPSPGTLPSPGEPFSVHEKIAAGRSAMTLIAIRERAGGPDGTNATLSFDGGPEYPVTVRDPFTGTAEEARLEWYFEEHLRFPFVKDVEAREAAARRH